MAVTNISVLLLLPAYCAEHDLSISWVPSVCFCWCGPSLQEIWIDCCIAHRRAACGRRVWVVPSLSAYIGRWTHMCSIQDDGQASLSVNGTDVDLEADNTSSCSADSRRLSRRRPSSIVGVTGLRNLGNTCYMNSILQVLRYAHQLLAILVTTLIVIKRRCADHCSGTDKAVGRIHICLCVWIISFEQNDLQHKCLA